MNGSRIIELIKKHPSANGWQVIRVTSKLQRESDEQRGYLCAFCIEGVILPVRDWYCRACRATVTRVFDAVTLKEMAGKEKDPDKLSRRGPGRVKEDSL